MDALPVANSQFQRKDADNGREDDFCSFEFRGRKVQVFRRLVNGKRTANYYVKFELKGKQVYRGTGEEKKSKAVEIAKLLVNTAMADRWDALRETKLRQDKPVATIGQIMERYEKGSASST